jgi:DNA-binding YbaB/EbfC family protein
MSDAFNPFGGGGGGMAGMLGGLQQQMAALQAQAEREEVEGTAGGGLVVIRMNGAQEVISVRIDPKAHADREMLEDLLVVATNDAVRKSKEAAARGLAGLAQSMGLPPGLF